MKKRIILAGLVLSLVLSLLAPAAALADDSVDISASGIVTDITPGLVSPIGNSGRWRVEERDLIGFLSGDINGAFIVTYDAKIQSTETQAGKFRGTLVTDDVSLTVKGRIQPLTMVLVGATPEGDPIYAPMLTISGSWKLHGKGNKGKGDFGGYIVFIPTPEGHVGSILDSGFELSGSWDVEEDDDEDDDD